MTITIPRFSLVLLIGPSGAGKSTFARRHFRPTEILSSDFCRALVCDDEGDQSATNDAFELLHMIVAKRLQRQRLTVIDATNVQRSARQPLAEASRKFNAPLVGIVFLLPIDVCHIRNRQRPDRMVDAQAIQSQMRSLQSSLDELETEGFYRLYKLDSVTEADSVVIERR